MLLQASEEIAKKYGGNKQKIAQAVQSGLLNATEAVLAGMFIDRIRAAAETEKVETDTIAQQVLSPTPEAVPGMLARSAMPQGMPPQGMPQPQMTAQMPRGMGGTPQAAQMQAMQQQMAPRPSVAGMNQIPVNPNMVANAASGGLVAFAGGGEIQGYAKGDVINGMSEEDIIRLENNARLFNEANEQSLSDNLGPMISTAPPITDALQAGLVKLDDSRYNPGNAGEFGFSTMDEAEGIRRSGALSDLNREIEKQEERLSQSSYSFESPEVAYEDQRGTIENNIKRLKDKRAALVNASSPKLQMESREELIIPPDNDPFADYNSIDFSPDADPAVYGLEADPNARDIGITKEVAPEVVAGVAPGVVAGVAPGVASEVVPEAGGETTVVPEAGGETIDNKVPDFEYGIPKDQTQSQFDTIEDIIGKSDSKYKTFLESEAASADKAKKQDLYTAMAEFGFRMAGSDSPYFLQAAGKAGADTMPSIRAATKDATARKKDAQEKLALGEAAARVEKINMLKLASEKSTGERKLQLDAAIAKNEKDLKVWSTKQTGYIQMQVADKYVNKNDAAQQLVTDIVTNMKDLREAGKEGFAGKSNAELTRMAINESRMAKESAFSQELKARKDAMDLDASVVERIKFLMAENNPDFMNMTYDEKYAHAKGQILQKIPPSTAGVDADAARINQS